MALALAASAALASSVAAAGSPDVLVITDTHHPVVTPTGTRVILLDTPARLKAELSAQLPADPQQAASLARQRLQAGGAELQQRFRRAYEDVAEAWRLGITHIPAVVVDRHFVIYGDVHVEDALARIQTYRSAHP